MLIAAMMLAASVTIPEPVKADGQPLAAGTYDVRVTDERPVVDGNRIESQRVVEFVQNGKVVARDVAEVFESQAAVGTAGPSSRAIVQTLKEKDFVRIVVTDAGARYLIHLPTASFSQPAVQPQSKSRVERIVTEPEPPQPSQPQR